MLMREYAFNLKEFFFRMFFFKTYNKTASVKNQEIVSKYFLRKERIEKRSQNRSWRENEGEDGEKGKWVRVVKRAGFKKKGKEIFILTIQRFLYQEQKYSP